MKKLSLILVLLLAACGKPTVTQDASLATPLRVREVCYNHAIYLMTEQGGITVKVNTNVLQNLGASPYYSC